MLIRIQIEFIDDNSIPEIKKVYVKSSDRIILKRVDPDDTTQTETLDINLEGSEEGEGFVPSDIENIAHIRSENSFINVNLISSGNSSKLVKRISNFDDISYVYTTSGETESEETTLTEPSFLPKNRSYEQKQEKAINAIQKWRKQKKEWLLEANGYIDINPEIPKHLGLWLKAVDKALITEFQNPDTDPLVVEAMAKQAAKGPKNIAEIKDFAVYLNKEGIDNHQQGPAQELLWVSRGDGQDISKVTPLDLEASFTYSGQDLAPELPENYDPTDESLLVANQIGFAVITDTDNNIIEQIETGNDITVRVQDPDSVKTDTITYQWQLLSGSVWEDIASETADTYTITQTANEKIRVRITYEDNFGPDQQIESNPIKII